MAPEVLDGQNYGWSADVYSFGMLLWSLWTHQDPFEGTESQFELFKMIIEGKQQPIPDTVPKTLVEITDSCRSRSPDARPNISAVVQRIGEVFQSMMAK
jgi:serine/threonine protein kinase